MKFDILELVEFCLGAGDYPDANFTKYQPLTTDELRAELNRKQYSGTVPVTYRGMLGWAAAGADDGTGVPPRIEKLEGAELHASGAIRGAAKAALTMIQTPGMEFDFSLPDRVAMLDGLVSAKVLTAADRQALLDVATVQLSEVEQLFEPGTVVTASHCNFVFAKLDAEFESRNPS